VQSILTAIDDPHASQIAEIWGELKAVFGLTTLTGDLRPHLSFAVAEHYDPAAEQALASIAARGAPFRIETHGIGLTEGPPTAILTRKDTSSDLSARPAPDSSSGPSHTAADESSVPSHTAADESSVPSHTLIYLHVTRTGILDDVHHVIHHATQPLAHNPRLAYADTTWLPHIAVATAPIAPGQLPAILDFLRRRDYAWHIPATNLCLNPSTSSPTADWLRFDLKGVPTMHAAT
jgi:hypothetical protein